MTGRKKAAMLFGLWLCGMWGTSAFADVSDPNEGWRAWALLGATPELARFQELRVGYEGLLPTIELAVGGLHLDGPDPGVQEWSVRGYVIAHALSTQMVASFLGGGAVLPDGTLYGGLFTQYTYDKKDSFSGGYIVGGLVDWPKNWQTVVEYQTNVWNNVNNSHAVVAGLRRRF